MAIDYAVPDTFLTGLADSIRAVYDEETQYSTGDMIQKISEIPNKLESKNVVPTTTQQTITPSTGKFALSEVTVEAIQTETKTITENGTYTPTSGKFFSSVTTNIQTGVVMQMNNTNVYVTSTTMGEQTNTRITVAESGTYDIYWHAGYGRNSGNASTQLYVNGSATGSATNASQNGVVVHVTQSLTAGQTVGIGLKSASSSYRANAGNLIIVKQ